MNEDRYNQLVEKLNHFMLNADGSIPSVSPALRGTGVGMASPALYITPNMDLEHLSQNQTILAHVLLHKFYSTGCKTLTRQDIEALHGLVIKKLPSHDRFDRLDDDKNDR